jgi:hypothetical protein
MSQTQRDTTPTNQPTDGNNPEALPASQQRQVWQSGRNRTSVNRQGYVTIHQDSRRSIVGRPVPESPSVTRVSFNQVVSQKE